MPVINKYPVATDLPYGQILGNSILEGSAFDNPNINLNWADPNEIFLTKGFYFRNTISNGEIITRTLSPNSTNAITILDTAGGNVGGIVNINSNSLSSLSFSSRPFNGGNETNLTNNGISFSFNFPGQAGSFTYHSLILIIRNNSTNFVNIIIDGAADDTAFFIADSNLSLSSLTSQNDRLDSTPYYSDSFPSNPPIIYPALFYAKPEQPIINVFPTVNSIQNYGSKLRTLDIQGGLVNVPGTFYWKNPNQIPNVGINEYDIIFVPENTGRYEILGKDPEFGFQGFVNSGTLYKYFGLYDWDTVSNPGITDFTSIQNLIPPGPGVDGHYVVRATGINKGIVVSVSSGNSIYKNKINNQINTLPNPTLGGTSQGTYSTIISNQKRLISPRSDDNAYVYLSDPIETTTLKLSVNVLNKKTPNIFLNPIATNINAGQTLNSSQLLSGIVVEDIIYSNIITGSGSLANPSPNLQSLRIINDRRSIINQYTYFNSQIAGQEPAYIDFNWPALTFPVGQNVNIYQTGIFVFRNTGEYPIDLYFSGIADDQMYLITGWNGTLIENDGFDNTLNIGTDNFPLTKRTIPANSINALTLKNGPPGGPTYGIVRIFGEELLNGYLPGTFAWQDPSSVPVGGTNSYPVTFTPLDTNNYNSITFNVSLTVNKSNPTITTMPTVNPITTYGPNLNSLTLNGGAASVPGTFVWTSPNIVPNFGTTSQSVTFIPSDTDSFNQVTFNINVIVQNRATPSIISNPTASTITYLQTLNNSNLQGGSASVEGTFAWTNPSFAPNAGTNNYNVVFTPNNNNYISLIIPISLTVNKANPIINFPNIPKLNKSLQNQYILNATSNHSESQIIYSSSNTNVATVSGIKLNLISFGFSTITAFQAETANFNSSTLTRQLEIISSRFPKIVAISNLPNGLMYNLNNQTLQGIIEDEGNYHVKFYLEEDGVICEKTLNLMVSNKNKRYLYSVNNPINIGFIKYNAQERIGQEDIIESYDHPIYGKVLRHSKLGTIYGYIKDIKEEIEVYNHPVYGPILRNTRNGTIYGYTGDSTNMPNYINNLYGI